MQQTKINWADMVWNPITGCSPVGEGCRNCYAKRMAQRLRGRFGYPARDPFAIAFHPGELLKPKTIEKPKTIFVCSMGDLFHEEIPREWIMAVFQQIWLAKQHTFIILTKRPRRMLYFIQSIKEHIPNYDLSNIVLGVSVWDQKSANEFVHIVLQVPGKKILSIEPILGPINIIIALCTCPWPEDAIQTRHSLFCPADMRRPESPKMFWPFDAIIVGPETGPHRRPCEVAWIRNIKDQCAAVGVPLFVKALNLNGKISTDMAEWPEYLRVRQLPWSLLPPLKKGE